MTKGFGEFSCFRVLAAEKLLIASLNKQRNLSLNKYFNKQYLFI